MTRLRFMLLVLLLFAFASQASAKHIIIAYDISKSMYRVKGQTRMTERDLNRLNNYLVQLLFIGFPQDVSGTRDRITLPHAEEPLYQAGDVLSYFDFETTVADKFTRKQNVRQVDFAKELPKTARYAGYQGNNTDIIRARAHIYDKLYKQEDPVTYWILVSDEDLALSEGAIKDLQFRARVAKFEKDFFQPPFFELIVNTHVTVRMHKIFRYDQILPSDAVYAAVSHNPGKPAQMIAFSKDAKTGSFLSENLRVDTSNENTEDFQLDRIEGEIRSEDGTPLHKLEAISLGGVSPPKAVNLKLPPGTSTTKSSSNELQLTLHYKYKSEPKERKYSVNYKLMIDTLYLALQAKPNDPLDEMTFVKDGDKYVNKETFILNTESPEVDKFRVIDILWAVRDKTGNDLHTGEMPMDVDKLPALLLPIQFPDEEKFENRKNQLTLNINYKYDGSSREHKIFAKYKLRKKPSVVPFVIGAILIGIGLITLLALWLYKTIGPRGSPLDIKLQETSPTAGTPQSFTLKKGEALAFQSAEAGSAGQATQHIFPIDCGGYLTYDGKALLLHQPFAADSTTPITLTHGQEFSLESTVGGFDIQVQVSFGKGTSTPSSPTPSESPGDDDLLGGGTTTVSPTPSTSSGDDDLLGGGTTTVDNTDPLNQ